MEPDHATIAVAAAAALVAGVSKGGFGGGVGFVSTLTLSLVIPPAQAVAVMLPVLIAIDQLGLATWWRKWSLAAVLPAILAAAVGIGLGALLFNAVSPAHFRLGLGVIALSFLGFQLARARGWRPPTGGGRTFRAGVWGAAAGFTSTISHAGGPPVTIYLLGEKLEKAAYQASTVLLFWAINLMKLGPYAALGVFDFTTLTLSAMLIPAAFVGVAIGVWAHKRVPDAVFLKVMAALLFCTAIKLIWDGASGL